MLRREFPKTGEFLTIVRGLTLGLVVPACLLTFPTAGLSEKSYLDAIQLEAEKLGQPAATGEDEQESPPEALVGEDVKEFERELEAQFRGSYLFYRKLPARSQEEVFLEHKQGASIEEVRKTIMNRYLHSR